MTIPTLPIDIEDLGIVGPRSLRVLQLVRIGRHTSTAMLIPHGGIWVVSGRGPETGSNGSGKTILLGATSLLNGDPQWGGENGIGPNAARLLFDHNRARVDDVRYADAPHGYIIGAYLLPDRIEDAVTVWMRIERHSSTYVQVRWCHGVRLVDGDSEETRFTHANDLWNNLRDNDPLTVTTYAEKLFGKTPRCIAYIRARGSEENQDRGLLALGQRPFRPRDLATQVITLAGKHQAVEDERKFRQELDANESSLASKKADYHAQYRREEQELRDIAARSTSRARFQDASRSWQRYLSIGTLLAYSQAAELARQVTGIQDKIDAKMREIASVEDELARLPSREELLHLFESTQNALKEAKTSKDGLVKESGGNAASQKGCNDRLFALRPLAARALGLSQHDAEQRVASAREVQRKAEWEVERVKELTDQATSRRNRLQAGRGGPAGRALDALDAEGVTAVSVVDVLTLDGDARAHWEARLSPYANAVIVPRSQHKRAREVLTRHPGTPLLALDDNQFPVGGFIKLDEPGILTRFLRELQRRTPTAGPDWVIDTDLTIEIPGGYTIPLTDRLAAIEAAENELSILDGRRHDVEQAQTVAGERLAEATEDLAAVEAKARLEIVEKELENLRIRENELVGLIADARDREDTAQAQHAAAAINYKEADRRRSDIEARITELKTGDNGLGSLHAESAEVREKSRGQKVVADQWQQAAEITDLGRAEREIAEQDIVLDIATRDTYYHEARTLLRQAIEAVIGSLDYEPPLLDGEIDSAASSADEFIAGLNTELRQLHKWCDNPRKQNVAAERFDAISGPLRAWLDWHGAEDDAKKAEIEANRETNKSEIEAAEAQASETQRWINSLRENQIAIITKAFRDIEVKLNELLIAVRQDPISLRPRYSDLNDTSQPLRWELHPQWIPPGAKPVDYSNPPNTAELIILHTLLATASLVAATNSQGRMLILDESGNNLDGPNLTKVSTVLQRVATRYGLTIVLACQDLYTDRVARHGAAMIQLLRPSQREPLNAAPAISHGGEDATLLETLMPYLSLGRADGTANSAEESQ